MRVRGINVLVALLFMVFGWSSWIDINGLWVELPLLVPRLPEGWNLPAYFTIIIQLANVGPLAYGLAAKFSSRRNSVKLESATIYVVIAIGAISLLLLAFLWDVQTYIGGIKHSTVLLVLTFFLSLVDCTSSVTFLPFMSQFLPCYMTAFYIGEGLSGLIPAIVAFIQGAGEYTCVTVNATDNSTGNTGESLQPQYSELLFPVKDFFLTLFTMLMLSMGAFMFLKHSTYCKSEYQVVDDDISSVVNSRSPVFKDEDEGQIGNTSSVERLSMVNESGQQEKQLNKSYFIILLVVIAFINALSNGVLPSIQTYSLLPYGHIYYSLGVKLSTLANPLACFIAFAAVPKQKYIVFGLTAVVAVSASYIIAIASYSPLPPVHGQFTGILMVLVWILFVATVSYLKVLISNLVIADGHSALFWLGVSTQAGSFIGAITTFLCVTVFGLLKSAPLCSDLSI